MGVDAQICFYRQLFVDPVKPQGCTKGPLVPLSGTNKTVGSATLLPTTVWTYPVIVAVYVDYWMYSTAVCVLMEGIAHLRLPTHPPPIHAIRDITAVEEKLSQNPAVSAT